MRITEFAVSNLITVVGSSNLYLENVEIVNNSLNNAMLDSHNSTIRIDTFLAQTQKMPHYIINDVASSISITDSNFTDNTVDQHIMQLNETVISITNTRIGDNTGDKDVISSSESSLNLTNVQFYSNIITSGTDSSEISLSTNDQLNITDSSFIGVTSQYLDCGFLNAKGSNKVLIDNSQFSNYYGFKGGVTCFDSSSNGTITRSNYTDIHSSGEGSFKITSSSRATFDTCRFTSSSSTNTSGMHLLLLIVRVHSISVQPWLVSKSAQKTSRVRQPCCNTIYHMGGVS